MANAGEGKVLSQQEIDALLSALDSEEVEVVGTQEQQRKVMPYDFKRPERVSRDQLRALATLHEVFTRSLQAALSAMLRTIVDVRVANIDQMTYSEFINSLPNPTCFNVISCEPLEGNIILEIGPQIAFPIFERLVGGGGRGGSPPPERPLSELEWKILDNKLIQNTVLKELRETWGSITPINFQLRAHESNPQLLPVTHSNDAVIAVQIELSVGENRGFLNLCVPVTVVEPVLDKVATHTMFARGRTAPPQREALTAALASAEVTVAAFLVEQLITFEDLKNLQVGDIIVTNHATNDPAILCVGEQERWLPKHLVQLGATSHDRKAVKVLKQITPRELTAGKVFENVKIQKSSPQPASDVQKITHVPVQCAVVIAEKTVSFAEVLDIKHGTVIEFPKSIYEPLDFVIGNKKAARGKVVKIGERFGFQLA